MTIGDAIKGILVGGFFGGLAGLGVCVWLFDSPLLFTGDTIVIGAAVFGVAGYFLGDQFFDWVKEYWWWFS